MKLDSNFVFSKIDALEFGIMSPKMIQKMSAVAITSSELYDIDGFPVDGGLSDLRMGVIDPGLTCKTCGNTIRDCPGHWNLRRTIRYKSSYMILKQIPKLISKN